MRSLAKVHITVAMRGGIELFKHGQRQILGGQSSQIPTPALLAQQP